MFLCNHPSLAEQLLSDFTLRIPPLDPLSISLYMYTSSKVRPLKTYSRSQLPLKLNSNSSASILLKSSNWLCSTTLTSYYYLTHHFSQGSLLVIYLPTECLGSKHPLKEIFWLILSNNNHPRSQLFCLFPLWVICDSHNPSRTQYSPIPHQALYTTRSTWVFQCDTC